MSRRRAAARAALVAAALAALALAAAACGRDATITLAIVLPDGQTQLPAGTVLVRVRLDDPPVMREAIVADDGSFALDLALPATGRQSRAHFEAVDAGGAMLAVGHTPPLPLGGFDDTMAIFVSPPGRTARLLPAFRGPRHQLATTTLPYGVLFAGGYDGSSMLLTEIEIYNAYTHSFQSGAPLPTARAHASAFARADGVAVLFGGEEPGQLVGKLSAFDTNVAPAGQHFELADFPDLAREGAPVALRGDGQLVVAGSPVALIDLDARTAATLAVATPDAYRATRRADGSVLISGFSGSLLVAAEGSGVMPLPGLVQGLHGAALLPDGSVLLIGGYSRLASGLTADDTPIAPFPLLARDREDPVVAVLGNTLVVLGGDVDSTNGLTVETFDAATLAPRGLEAIDIPPGFQLHGHPLPSGTLLVHLEASSRLYIYQPPVSP